MNLLKTVFETVAQFLPDREHDPLLERDGFLGKPLVRVDAETKVKGTARFTSEFDIPNLSHATLVFSTIAKGKVSTIDTERAKRTPGVLEVLTWKNMPKLAAPLLVDITDMKKGMAGSNLPILQDSSVHWNGQPIAIVVAETLAQAEHAASLLDVEYEADPPAVSFDLLKAQAVLPSDVLGEPASISMGSVEKGMAEAAARVDHVYLTPSYNHNALEPHATIALWDEDGSLVVLDSTQSAYMTSRSLALIFGDGCPSDFRNVQKHASHLRVEMSPAKLTNSFFREFERSSALIRPLGGDGVQSVSNGENPRAQENCLSLEAARVAAAVKPLMVHEDNFGGIREKRDVLDQLEPDLRMLLHELPFFGGQRSRLEQDAVGHAKFSNVV